MSYRIDYAPVRRTRGGERFGSVRPFAMTLGFFALFALLVHAFWPEGAAILRHLLFGEEGESMLHTLEAIAHSLDEGHSLRDAAVGAFRDVLHGH